MQRRIHAAVWLVVVLLVAAAVGLIIHTSRNTVIPVAPQGSSSSANQPENLSVTPDPTPDPFADLTIPYLKDRRYESQLGQLERYAATPTYTSYLTSYPSDTLTVRGLLTVPSGEIPANGWPAIVFVHGYIPPQSYRTTENYAAYVDYLARNGFVVFKIDLRGHGQSEGEASGAYYSSDYVIDTLNAVAALAAGSVPVGSIGLWGHSMAGNVVFRTAAVDWDIPAVVIWAGAVYTYNDFGEYGISDNSYRPPDGDSERVRRRRALFATHGEFNPASAFWQSVVPTNYIAGYRGAIQVHHAADDAVVDIRYSRNLIQVLESTAVPHELHEYPSGGHNLSGSFFSVAMERTVQFFKEHLSR